jgi:haloalkane dehalogenase
MIALGNPRWQSKSPEEVAAFVAGGLPDGIAHAERLTPEFVEGIVAPWSDNEGAVSLIRNASALNTNHTMELVDRHSSITAATLVLWGVRDPWQPLSDGHRLAQEIPGARMVEVDASHWIPHDAPEQFAAAVLGFLSDTPGLPPTPPGSRSPSCPPAQSANDARR